MDTKIEELMALGLSKVEAARVVKRNLAAAEKQEAAKDRAERLLPKAQEALDYAEGRVAHWTEKAREANEKVERYMAIIEE